MISFLWKWDHFHFGKTCPKVVRILVGSTDDIDAPKLYNMGTQGNSNGLFPCAGRKKGDVS